MKKLFFSLCVLFSLQTSAQMVDLLGGLAVQGSIGSQAAQSASQGISAAKRLRILQDIQDIAMQVKTNYFGTYTYVNKDFIQGNPLQDLNWALRSVSNNLFYIQLNQVDNQLCRYLVMQNVSAKDTLVNGSKAEPSACSEKNEIRFIFD